MPGLPDDWRPADRKAYERAWDEHPQRDLLNERKAKRDEKGMPVWESFTEPAVDHPDWVAIWQRRTGDPRETSDPRPDICIIEYPQSWADRQSADARAIADEHADD